MKNNIEPFQLILLLIAVVVIGTLLGAIILRGSIGIFKTLADSVDEQSSVPEPPIVKSMMITFVVTLINSVFGFVVSVFAFDTRDSVILSGDSAKSTGILIAYFSVFPFSFMVMAAMLTALLPTSFGRALKVTLIYFLLIVALIAIFYTGVMVAA